MDVALKPRPRVELLRELSREYRMPFIVVRAFDEVLAGDDEKLITALENRSIKGLVEESELWGK